VRKEVELLEDHADPLPNDIDLDALARDLLAFEENAPAVDRLEQVHAAEQGALAAAARSDDDERLARVDGDVDAVEHEVVAEALPDILDPHEGSGRACRLDDRP
jgi:hypothetical protein